MWSPHVSMVCTNIGCSFTESILLLYGARRKIMAHLNRVVIIGETLRAPEEDKDPDGRPAASFEILIEHRYMKDGQPKTRTDRALVVAVGDALETSRRIRGAGESVLLEGRLHCESVR